MKSDIGSFDGMMAAARMAVPPPGSTRRASVGRYATIASPEARDCASPSFGIQAWIVWPEARRRKT